MHEPSMQASSLRGAHLFPFPAGEYVCIHLRAAAKANGFTPNLRAAAAAHLLATKSIQVNNVTGICSCSMLADILKTAYFRPEDGFCTCHDCMLHGTCCHLLAAVKLPTFREVALPAVVQEAEGDSDQAS